MMTGNERALLARVLRGLLARLSMLLSADERRDLAALITSLERPEVKR